MKFYKAVIFTPKERENDNSNNYYNLIDATLVVQALLFEDDSEPIMLGDNMHEPIEEEINSFLLGIDYAGEYVEVEHILIIADDPCDEEEVMYKFFNKDYEKLEV